MTSEMRPAGLVVKPEMKGEEGGAQHIAFQLQHLELRQ